MADSTLLVKGFDDVASGFVNNAPAGGSTVLFRNSSEMLRGGSEFSYGTHASPATRDLCCALSALEKAHVTLLTPSGLSALALTFLSLLAPGDHALVPDAAYQPLRELCDCVLRGVGVDVDYYDQADEKSLKALLRSTTKLVHLESPASGTFEVVDVDSVCCHVKNRNSLCAISMDNSWATPLLFKPLAHGADVSITALTKYPAGASDVMMGSVSCVPRVAQALQRHHALLGLCAGSADAWSVLRGLKTAKARLGVHHRVAVKVASVLKASPRVGEVLCPALSSSPYFELWKANYELTNGVIAFTLKSGIGERALEASRRFLDSLQVFGLGWSWGGYKSLACVASLSHRRWPTRITGSLIRLQLGFEDERDLIWDLEGALAKT